MFIPSDIQKSLNAWDVNSLVLSWKIVLIIWSGNYACNLITWVNNLANIRLWVDNKHTCDHLVDVFIQTIKYLNGSHSSWMGPQIWPWILSRNLGDSIPTLASDGTNFP
jgi:hypothetical protein